jgi:uncharacterized membrane protein YoaK (UPF0700 family)
MKHGINALGIVQLTILSLIVSCFLVVLIGNFPTIYEKYILISLGVFCIGLLASLLLPLWFKFEDKNNASKPFCE